MTSELDLRLLLIEDSSADALLLQAALEEVSALTFDLTHVTRLDRGLTLLDGRNFDLVLLDLGLPDCTGIETFQRLHWAHAEVPVVVLTALDSLNVSVEALQAGAQDYLVKRDIQSPLLERAMRHAIERNRLQTRLIDSRDHLRRLAAHIEAMREAERTRISREIHDELGQKLTSIKMDIGWVTGQLVPGVGLANVDPLTKRLHEAQQLVDCTIDAVRRLALELRPTALDHLGLGDAIRDEARRFGQRTGITLQMRLAQEDTQLSSEAATACFRIFQELLTNVARHARAKSVSVELSRRRGEVQLEVHDDGIGMPADTAGSLGLLGMRERAAFFGGSVTFDLTGARGTRAVVRMPLSQT